MAIQRDVSVINTHIKVTADCRQSPRQVILAWERLKAELAAGAEAQAKLQARQEAERRRLKRYRKRQERATRRRP